MKRIDSFRPALAEKTLMENNFFELYPFDGGGSFIHHGILGSMEDALISRAIVEENALAEFGDPEEIDFLRFERWSTIEKSCWINRMYFIVPPAHQYARTGDARLAGLLRHILLRFKRKYAPPVSCEAACELERNVLCARDNDYNAKSKDFDASIPYQWFDFQPASRILHILHTMWFLRKAPELSDADWRELDELIYEHGRNIFWAESFGAAPAPGNHQALRALALLCAAHYLRDLPETAEWRRVALNLCEYHILNDFLPDGMLIDLSPSYHFFESWIGRDMLELAGRESPGLSAAASDRMRKAFAVCRRFRQPDGLSPVISDGYPLDMTVFLKTLPPEKTPDAPAFVLPDARMAIRSEPGRYFLLDASPLLEPLSHYHAGKLGVTWFTGGCPFLVDSGCCNYDDHEFAEWFKQVSAHSTLLIDGQGDSLLEGRYHWLAAAETSLSDWEGNSVTAVSKGTIPAWNGIVWQRRATLENDRLILDDTVESAREVTLDFLFNLHPAVTAEPDGSRVLLTSGGVKVLAEFAGAVEVLDGLGFVDFRKVPCKRLRLRLREKGCRIQSRFTTLR
ncbi:MAG: Heparinase II/III-like protein [Lentisphaerae bacterium ADurb.Bin242]|nr:MAG: Heparinase II/III-like protein [Lentisphaerae bacterium ADurb.Bin242]